MKAIKGYLDLAIARHALRSDYGLAKKLGVRPSHISNYRNGRSCPDDKMAVRLAKLLDIDPLEIVAVANYNRAVRTENPVSRRLWQRLFKLVAHK